MRTRKIQPLDLPHPLIHLEPRPRTLSTSKGRSVLVTDPEGVISGENPHQGLWVYETRMLSRYRWKLGGNAPEFSAGSNVEQYHWMGYFIAAPPNCKETPTGECSALQETIELRISRFLGGGLHEEVEVTNHTRIETSLKLELEVECDFGDPVAARRGESGRLTRRWGQSKNKLWELEYGYAAEHRYRHQSEQGTATVHRGIRLRVQHSDSRPEYQGCTISFPLKLAPHGSWHACLDWIPRVEGHWLPVRYGCRASPEPDRKSRIFLQESTRFRTQEEQTLSSLVLQVLERSKRDLAALRLDDLDAGDHAWVPAAGIPTYTTLFGRDVLTVAEESSLLGSQIRRGVLEVLRRCQATKTDDWRDEQPGRIVHGVHCDPNAVLNYSPHGLYYGDVTASNFYPLVVAGLWHWTGDKDLVRPFLEPALKALAWADKYSLSRDGFYKYQTRSEQGEKNQGWKDSGDAIVHADGSQVEDPLGTCEMQAFVYASKLHLSQLLWWLGKVGEAAKLYKESQKLKERFNEVFWMPKEGYIALGIDAGGRLIRSIASDPGQCLKLGIVDEKFAPRVGRRLMANDLFSGWGVRTLSADHPAYNPFAYHRGPVWPVMNGMCAAGLARYGLHEERNALTKAFFEAASLFEHRRLPELFAGHPRDAAHPFPGMYTKADWPQAWTASAPFAMIRAMLGIVPFAPLEVLCINPVLPEWLPALTVERLRVGKAVVSLSFRRNKSGTTDYEVMDQKGPLHVLRHSKPWSLLDGPGAEVQRSITDQLKRQRRS